MAAPAATPDAAKERDDTPYTSWREQAFHRNRGCSEVHQSVLSLSLHTCSPSQIHKFTSSTCLSCSPAEVLAEDQVQIVVEAEDVNFCSYEWKCQLALTSQMLPLRKMWADDHGVPEDARKAAPTGDSNSVVQWR